MGTPIVLGIVFGPKLVAGLLPGATISGIQMAISASNTGGAWDNCKKEIEKQRQAAKKKFKTEYGCSYDDNIDRLIEETEDENKKAALIKEKEIGDDWKERKVAAVVGDTVGDPLKDTSGPAINILIKLGAITSLVFGSYIKDHHAFNVGTN